MVEFFILGAGWGWVGMGFISTFPREHQPIDFLQKEQF